LFGIEAVVLGPATHQHGLVRREGVATWRRLAEHAPVFDRAAAGGKLEDDGLLPVRVVVATTRARDRALRVPAVGERADRVARLAEGPAPRAGWLLLVDEGPGETWLYLADEQEPAAVLDGFLGRRGRTDFARARRRSRRSSMLTPNAASRSRSIRGSASPSRLNDHMSIASPYGSGSPGPSSWRPVCQTCHVLP
jgi:hypothetical protein